MPLAPKRVMHRKVQRGRQHGFATRDNYIDFGDIALVAMEPHWLNARVIEAARVAINRKLERKGQFLSYNRLRAHDLFYGRKVILLEGAAKNLSDFYAEDKEAK